MKKGNTSAIVIWDGEKLNTLSFLLKNTPVEAWFQEMKKGNKDSGAMRVMRESHLSEGSIFLFCKSNYQIKKLQFFIWSTLRLITLIVLSGFALVGSSVSLEMADSEIAALKEALQAQQKLLQNVYEDLEEEREASATATSEALSMILRLQGEKGTEKLEASQYKRLVEEKMHHAEECLTFFQELIYSKEMEIASLQFQIQAYRYKLLSLGFSDPCVGKMRFPDNPYLRRNDVQVGEIGFSGNVRRNNSLPPIRLLEAQSKKRKNGYEESQELIARKNDEEIQLASDESMAGDFSSYWEQIRRLDDRVKELSYRRDVERAESDLISRNHDLSSTMAASSMLSTALRRDPSLGTMGRATPSKMESETTYSCSTSKGADDLMGFDTSSRLGSETIRSSMQSTTVHDVFEVPQNNENPKFSVSQTQEQKNFIFKGERLRKQQSVPPETPDYIFKEKDEWIKEVLLFARQENKLLKEKDGVSVDFPSPLSGLDSPSQYLFQQLKRRIELLENDRKIAKQEASEGEDHLELLREINEQLKMIQFEIDTLKSKKSLSRDDSPFMSLIESMLCCSL
ncbi:hypothetical protein NE237_026591 [Protea cynaroides]|uniref:GTD-binding domain-containing protein n=1 Tax=Protea cynaroides TaxID=273540 RepID=A0A9Q0K2F9_9MAGN|nr:hypothetical protein NE237_026591 [Protea cynaroides]